MAEARAHPEDTEPVGASSPESDLSLTHVRQAATVLVVAGAVAWLVYLLVTHDALGDAWTTQVLLCGVALLSAAWGAIHRHHHWTIPLRRLREQVTRAHRGEVAIESLSELGGGPAELVPLFQDLLRDLRQHKASIAALEAETRQRVASRTGALERTIESLRQQATRDALTGLFNRRFLDAFLPQAVSRCQSTRAELCVLMMDVDHFKRLNDTLGHAAGDSLLKSIGQIIRSTARGEDVPFRFGGDEFLVLMLGSGEKAGKALAERLTKLVDGLCRTYHVTPRPRLSIGVVTLASLEQPTLEALLVEADKRLYAVKAAHHSEERDKPSAAPVVVPAPTAAAPGHAVAIPAAGVTPTVAPSK